jgi:hypothetical protein
MIHDVEVKTIPLDCYAAVAQLSRSVAELRAQASVLAPRLAGRTVWMVSSTERGGGVAEMMPREVAMLHELGVDTHWAVIEPDNPILAVSRAATPRGAWKAKNDRWWCSRFRDRRPAAGLASGNVDLRVEAQYPVE